jgi:GNAT superfamily N-acetyltransferase
MSITIRIATSGDAASACNVLCRSISHCCVDDHNNDETILNAWLGNKTPETVASWFGSPANFTVVACEGDAMVGVAMVTRQGKIVLCHVLPERQFTGVGKAMLAALETQVREWGLRGLQVQSTVTATPFYMRNGYIANGTARSRYGAEAITLSKQFVAGAYARKPGCGCGK